MGVFGRIKKGFKKAGKTIAEKAKKAGKTIVEKAPKVAKTIVDVAKKVEALPINIPIVSDVAKAVTGAGKVGDIIGKVAQGDLRGAGAELVREGLKKMGAPGVVADIGAGAVKEGRLMPTKFTPSENPNFQRVFGRTKNPPKMTMEQFLG